MPNKGIKKRKTGLSGPACKELGCHASSEQQVKSWGNWKIKTPLKLSESEVTGQIAAPKSGETDGYSESQLIGAEIHSWKPSQEPELGYKILNFNWQITGGSVWTSLRVKNSRETIHRCGYGAHFCECYFQKPRHVHHVTIKNTEKLPRASSRRMRKATILQYPRAFWSS